jgi:hypothetical protein
MKQEYRRKKGLAKYAADGNRSLENTHDSLPNPWPHNDKIRISVIRIAPNSFSPATRMNIHRYFHTYFVQSLTGIETFCRANCIRIRTE